MAMDLGDRMLCNIVTSWYLAAKSSSEDYMGRSLERGRKESIRMSE
jgi:hypothetical protein